MCPRDGHRHQGLPNKLSSIRPVVRRQTTSTLQRPRSPSARRRVRRAARTAKTELLPSRTPLLVKLKSSLKGEIVLGHEDDDAGEADTTNRDTDKSLGDEEYREVAVRYEREAGREPELGDPHQSGWDIRSVDPESQEVRLIEVKGRGRPWDDVEVVELSGAQIRKAFEATEILVSVRRGEDG